MSLFFRTRGAVSESEPSTASGSTRTLDPEPHLATASRSLVGSQIALERAGTASAWNRLLDVPGGTVFHRWEWLSWIAPQLSCEFVPLMVVQAGTPVGVAPLLVRRRWGFASANIVPFPYLGPLVPVELLTATSYAMLRWARRHRVMSLELCLHPGLSAVDDGLGAAGLDEVRVDTFLIELADHTETELFARLSGDARTAIRRSAKRGVSVRTSTPADLREVLPAVHTESLNAGFEYADALGEALASDTLPIPARCATAVVDGRPVGVSVTLGGGCTAVGWIGAVYRADQSSQANAALIWDAITWASEEGYARLDMCGAPDPGIATFKRKFRPSVETHLVGRWQAPALTAARRFQQRP